MKVPRLRAWLALALLAAPPVPAAPGKAAETGDSSLHGVIDFHCHSGPDAVPRLLSDIELARLARQEGLRGLVLKNHFTQTADRAALAMATVEGIEIFGGIVLNRAVGGLNPEAVRQMARFEGGRGKVVWLPTWDARSGVREGKPSVPVLVDGKLAPGLAEVLDLIAENDLVLATGHSSPDEVLKLIPEAQRRGVRKILVTHAIDQQPTLEQLARMAALGAILELVWPVSRTADMLAFHAQVIKSIGAGHFLISSDLGQPANPLHTDGLRAFLSGLQERGVGDEDLAVMARENPACLLGLAP